ncbi:MAG: pyrroline-5-carboxylate reductase [Planctomycetota bacterium]|nr:pyrroline-5-carboxylate reductase [Planctomycetota bacterium]
MLNKKILLIGGGNMGRALLRGILKANLTAPPNLTVVDIHAGKLEALQSEFGVNVSTESGPHVSPAEIIILAVKPYTLTEVLDDIRSAVSSEQVILSIVAGAEASFIRDRLGKHNPVIRCMPNIAATVAAAATAISSYPPAGEEHLAVAETVFSAVGEVVRVDESLMDAVTGLSGSGPAYVYMVIEALCDGGVKMGLPRDVAMKLATQTVLGAAQLVKETGAHPAVLKDQVTTPGGTTIAAIHELEERGLRAMLISAVVTATEKSRDLNRVAREEKRGDDR